MDRNNFVQFCNLRCLCIANSCAACGCEPASFCQGGCDKALLFSLWLDWSLQDCNKLWHRSSSFGVQNVVSTHAYLAHRLMQYSFLWYIGIGGSVLHIDLEKTPEIHECKFVHQVEIIISQSLASPSTQMCAIGVLLYPSILPLKPNHKIWQLCLFIHTAAAT